jgi:hypothetical protein
LKTDASQTHFYACQAIENRPGTFEKVRQSMITRVQACIKEDDILIICCELCKTLTVKVLIVECNLSTELKKHFWTQVYKKMFSLV